MEVIRDPAAFPRPASGTAVTIGAYDGVHVGHRALIAQVCRLAAEHDLASVVVTFDRHPATVVRPASAPKLLCDLDQKLELLATTGVDYTLVIRFDEERAHEPAEEFVTEVLVDALGARIVSVGRDFHFGYRRGGNVALLQEMGARLGFEVVPIDLVAVPGLDPPVSSTAIRAALAAGDVALASRLLGRPHEVRGIVVKGDRRGRDLGFPTANVQVPEEIQLPADGIYAGWYQRPDGHRHPAAVSLGRRPTFHPEANTSLLEAHLLDFDGDLYGEPARVSFVARLRGEERFESAEALAAQIGRDVAATRELLTPANSRR
jgi:riboflavin kinase/FMN adenylyltransferase